MKTEIISVVNQKGGVGKTTTAVNLATIFAIMNKKTLIIDIDSQGNSSSGLGISQADRKYTSFDILNNLISIEQAAIKSEVPNLKIIPSNINLAGIEIELSRKKDNKFILKNQLVLLEESYDLIIIDCPPSLNLVTVNALVASTQVLIPMLCDYYSLEGLSHLLKTIEYIKLDLNSNLKILGVLLTMYDKRSKLTEMVEKDVRGCLEAKVFKTVIPRNVRVSEAPSHGKSVVMYDHKSSGALAYIQLVQEIFKVI